MTTEKTASNIYPSAFFSDELAVRLILHNARESFLLVNPQLLIVYCNKAARNGIRRFLRKEIFPGMCLLDLVPEDRKSAYSAIYQRVLTGAVQTTENYFRDEANNPVYFENTYQPAYDQDENIVGIIISSTNITDRKIAQQKTQISEQRLQFALEAAAQGAWDWNLQTNEVVYSESYMKLYGFEENELKNHVSEWMTRIHPDDSKKMQESVQEHLRAENPEYDSRYRIRAKDGSYRWVMAKGRLVSFDENGKPLRMIGTHTDITESVEREKELKLINERYNSMVKATHELLWDWDIPKDSVLRAKEGLRNVYGITDDAELKTVDAWLKHLHPEDEPKIRSLIKHILQGSDQETFEMEYRFRRENGSYSYIYDRCILIRDENDQPARLIGAAQDISERKRLEKELLSNELEYHRLIHQATVSSQEKERAEIGKELHDNINQVLTTTKLYLDLANSNTELREELIRKSLLNVDNIIKEIRLLSRSLMDPSIGDLGLLESIRDLIENIHLTKKLRIEFHSEELIEDLLNENQKLAVFRIIQESLNNVLRHAQARTVTIELFQKADSVSVFLCDDGIGFDPVQTKKGAGLKNIQNRIYLINGTLQLESTPGKGSLLKIQFPI